MKEIISKEFTQEIKSRLHNRIDKLDNDTFVDLWNTYAEEERKEFICSNNEYGINYAFMQHKNTECCVNIDCFALLTAQSKNLWNKNSQFVTIKDDSIVSIDTPNVSSSDYIDVKGLVEWVADRAIGIIEEMKKKREMDEADIREELFGVRAYAFINTTDYNNDGQYGVQTKEIEGLPLFNVLEWEFTILMKMKVSEVVYAEDYSGAMVVRLK